MKAFKKLATGTALLASATLLATSAYAIDLKA